MFSLLAILILAFAFLVLVITFFWVAHILAMRAQEKKEAEKLEPIEELLEEFEEVEESIPEPANRGKGYGANYGLLLGILACASFWIYPLMMALSFVGLFYSTRAVWQGFKYFRVVAYRGLLGFLLSVGSVGLHFLKAVGQLPAVPF